MVNILENYFKLKENGTSIRTEIVAGLVTFMTWVLFVLCLTFFIFYPY